MINQPKPTYLQQATVIQETFNILAAAKDAREWHSANWSNRRDDDGDLIMEIELGDDRLILLICPTNGDPPAIELMDGHGYDARRIEISDSWTAEYFRAWLESGAVIIDDAGHPANADG